MNNYYQVINGQRYSGTLIRNAKFRMRGQGDGKVSVQDAQDLWQIAMGGGRITEIEEATLLYLMEHLNWTDAAKNWMKDKLAEEVEKEKSYYKIIDGLKYDRKILNEADRLTAGKGDGRISQDDAELLLPLFGDFGDVTIVEERTLKYLLEHHKWTPKALDWFSARVHRISKQSKVGSMLRYITQYEFMFKHLGLAYFKEEALQQMLDFKNEISLPDALRVALNNLLEFNEAGSFLSYFDHHSKDEIHEFLEGGRLVLLPGDMASEPSLGSFPSPLKGESLTHNWIFGLELFDLTDNIYWVIVPRDGKTPAYNYIGGPNVEDNWPRYADEEYFVIEVKSCSEPYPGITVDVQDPDGKYFVAKSNEDGQVIVTGPAGNYSIYASDGWSYQSKTFKWDGKGQDQVKAVVLDC